MDSTLALAFCWLAAVAPQDPIDDLVARLRHDDIESRDAAEASLSGRGEEDVPRLRKLAAVETDREVRDRLMRAIDRMTSLVWLEDVAAAKKEAARAGKRLFVISAPGPVRGAT